ncbi:DgyrCDS10315 [Dimorphilus gyrociliatus]|nr:DgyrCDS10315 [Dimorphilus gyrociliatus]
MLRGLETFSQLVYKRNKDAGNLINVTNIEDYPRYAHRGVMLDTARHFMPMKTITKILDAMSYNKFNVFHWHVVDDQSFPYTLRKFPEMAEKGAYHPKLVYTRDDIERIKREARLRGIRVIPEFDTPGHTFSWGKSFPELLTPCWGQGRPDTPNYPHHGPREIINPTLESTFDFMRDLYMEIRDDFPDEYVHLGMDEAYYACWQSSPNVSDWMSKRNMSTYNQIEQYYSERLIKIVDKIGLKSIVWQDPLENNVTFNKETIIQVWKDKKNDVNNPSVKNWEEYAQEVAKLGYNFILSSPWYLNMISYGQDWRNYYEIEPTDFTSNENEKKLVKGGEACMWAEYVDGTNIHSRIWPRASAIAERLWSAKNADNIEDAKFRLDEHRCRMIRRGIPAQPILNGHCNGEEWEYESKEQPPQQSVAISNYYNAILITLIITNFFSSFILSR